MSILTMPSPNSLAPTVAATSRPIPTKIEANTRATTMKVTTSAALDERTHATRRSTPQGIAIRRVTMRRAASGAGRSP
jgi:hypothetical protein